MTGRKRPASDFVYDFNIQLSKSNYKGAVKCLVELEKLIDQQPLEKSDEGLTSNFVGCTQYLAIATTKITEERQHVIDYDAAKVVCEALNEHGKPGQEVKNSYYRLLVDYVGFGQVLTFSKKFDPNCFNFLKYCDIDMEPPSILAGEIKETIEKLLADNHSFTSDELRRLKVIAENSDKASLEYVARKYKEK